MFFKAMGLMSVALALTGTANAAPGARSSLLSDCFDAKVKAVEFSGVALITDLAGRPLLTRATGWKDLEKRRAISADTIFNVASISKLFTAVAVLQLIERGKLRLDDPVGATVPDLPPELAAATIRQLLLHRSGLGDYNEARDRTRIAAARTATDLLPLVTAEKLQFSPGSGFRYSNSGFVLLGAAVERVSDKSYSAYLRDHVFRPAAMTRSSVAAPRDFAIPLTNVLTAGRSAAVGKAIWCANAARRERALTVRPGILSASYGR